MILGLQVPPNLPDYHVSAPVLEIPSTIIIVPFDENEKLWESTPLVSDGPCDMHTPELMLEKRNLMYCRCTE